MQLIMLCMEFFQPAHKNILNRYLMLFMDLLLTLKYQSLHNVCYWIGINLMERKGSEKTKWLNQHLLQSYRH